MESDHGKLFIGGISWDTDEELLKEYFGKYGEIVEAVIMRDRTTGRARGFGFIVFADPAAAERVIIEKHMIDGRMVEAKKAVPRDDKPIINRNLSTIQSSPIVGRTKKIFVGGLPSTITESDFKSYFNQFGTITDVVVMYDHHTQRPRGFGFITYDSEDAVDRVLLQSFHELSGKMVEVKRAVPKEASPGPMRSPLIRTNNILNNYPQGYNMSLIGGFDSRIDSRFNPLIGDRGGFLPFGFNSNTGSLSPSYRGNSSFNNTVGYGRLVNPYYNGNQNPSRFTSPIGYNGSNTRLDSISSPNTRIAWGNESLGNVNNVVNPATSGSYLGSGSGNYGNIGSNWGPLGRTGYNTGNMNYRSGESDSMFGRARGVNGRNSPSVVAPPSSFIGSSGGYEDLYGNFSAYGDSFFRSSTPELDGTGSFRYVLGDLATDFTDKSSDGYLGTYSTAADRESNRGVAS